MESSTFGGWGGGATEREEKTVSSQQMRNKGNELALTLGTHRSQQVPGSRIKGAFPEILGRKKKKGK